MHLLAFPKPGLFLASPLANILVFLLPVTNKIPRYGTIYAAGYENTWQVFPADLFFTAHVENDPFLFRRYNRTSKQACISVNYQADANSCFSCRGKKDYEIKNCGYGFSNS